MINDIKKALLIALALFSVISQLSANVDYSTFTNVTLSPSSTAAGLGLYGDIPVSLYTGTPQVGIPIFNINSGRLNLPVSLSYHSHGVKVEAIASWVGLGWSLNAGGVITRTVRGLPDDQFFVYSSRNAYKYGDAGFLYRSNTVEDAYNNVTHTHIIETARDNKDGEPDLFYFNFHGYSGKFLFDNDGNIRLVDQTNFKISYHKSDSGRIDSFVVITPNAIKYVFATKEVTSRIPSISYKPQHPEDRCLMSQTSIRDDFPFYSSWYLSRIEDHNLGKILYEFEYVDEQLSYLTYGEEDKYIHQTFIGVEGKRLEKITAIGSSVVFEASHRRLDINHSNIPKDAHALTKIKLYNNTNSLSKQVSLNLGYFSETDCHNSCPQYLCKRLKLLGIEFQDNSGNSIKNYAFGYDNTPLPPRYSAEQDIWGYYNDNNATGMTPSYYYYPNDAGNAYYRSEYSIYKRSSYTGTEVFRSHNDRSPNTQTLQAGILTKITYPTGGYTTFEYEPHDFYFDGQTRIGGGLRIKKITDSDGNNQYPDVVESYEYKQSSNPAISSGKIIYLPQIGHTQYIDNNKYIRTKSVGGLGSTNGSHIGYEEVSIIYPGNGKEIYLYDIPVTFENQDYGCVNGNCIYERGEVDGYGIGGFQSSTDQFPYPPYPNFDWARGQLLETKVFDENGQLRTHTINEYEIANPTKVYCFVANVYHVHQGFSSTAGHFTDYYYKLGRYYNTTGWNRLDKSTMRTYDLGNAQHYIEQSVVYEYNNAIHKYPTKTTTTIDNGRELITEYFYPADYTLSANSNHQALNLMQASLHFHSPLIEKIISIDDGTGAEVIGGQFYKYHAQNATNSVILSEVYTTDIEASAANFIRSVSSGDPDPVYYRRDVSFNEYDQQLNPLRYTYENASSDAIIWHDRLKLPQAVMLNVDDQSVGYASFEGATKGNWNYNAIGIKASNSMLSAKTGNSYYNLKKGNISYADIREGEYVLSYWYYDPQGQVQAPQLTQSTGINDITAEDLTTTYLTDKDGWRYVERHIRVGNCTGNCKLVINAQNNQLLIDELRLYPLHAMCLSFQYNDDQNMVQVMDERNSIVSYDYDSFQRHYLTRDDKGNILQYLQYNYR